MAEKNYGSMKKYYSKGVMVLLVLIEKITISYTVDEKKHIFVE